MHGIPNLALWHAEKYSEKTLTMFSLACFKAEIISFQVFCYTQLD